MKLISVLKVSIALAILGAAASTLHSLATTLTLSELQQALLGTPGWRIALALLATGVSFGGLAIYERYATEAVLPGRISIRAALFVGAVSHAISNTLGFHILTGGALRYRAYRRAGVTVADIAQVMTLVGICVGMGSAAILTVSLLIEPATNAWSRPLGSLMALLLMALIMSLPALSRRLRLRYVTMPLLNSVHITRQMLVGVVEMAAAIFALYILLPANAQPGFSVFTLIFLGAMFVGILSHAPGSLGVFEAAMVAALPAGGKAEILAALLLYRLLYNLLPFCVAVMAITIQQLRPGHRA